MGVGMRVGRQMKCGGGFLPLMGATFVFYAFNNVQTSAMPAFFMDRGASALLASAQTSLFVLAAVLLRIALGPLSDRRGPRFVMVIGALGFVMPCALMPLCAHVWQVLVLRACQAVGLAAFHPCVSLAVTRLSSPERLGRRLGYVRFAATLSLLAGPALLFPIINAAGYRAFFWTLVACGLVGLVLLGSMGRCEVPAVEQGSAVRGMTEDGGSGNCAGALGASARRWGADGGWLHGAGATGVALLAAPLLCAIGYGAVLNFGKALVATTLPGANDGLLFTFVSAGGLVGNLVCGRLADATGVRRVVFGCLAAVATGALVLAFVRTLPQLAGAGMLFGAGYFGATTALSTALALRVAEASRGQALALQQSCLDAGIAAGSLVAGAVVQAAGVPGPAFVVVAVLMGLAAVAWMVATHA